MVYVSVVMAGVAQIAPQKSALIVVLSVAFVRTTAPALVMKATLGKIALLLSAFWDALDMGCATPSPVNVFVTQSMMASVARDELALTAVRERVNA